MTNWDVLVEHLEQRWNKSRSQVCEQLTFTIRYAIITPLSSVKALSDLLEKNTKSSQIRDWAKECHQTCQYWLESYGKIQDRCLSNLDDNEMACKCILQDVGALLASSVDILFQNTKVLDHAAEEEAEVGKTLFQKLSIITQIHYQLRAQDLSWLMAYINYEEELRGGPTLG